MIKIKILFENTLEFINTDYNVIYKTFVNKKYNSKLNFAFYKQIHLNKILNAKSIIFEGIGFREYYSKK